MATYYVATAGGGGNDGNDGSIGSPWLTPQKAANTVIANDTVYFRAGSYTNATVWTFANSGSAGNYITYQNYPTESVTITLVNAVYRGMDTDGHDYLKFIGINVIGDEDAGGYGFYLHLSDYITLQYCTFTRSYSTSVYAQDSTYITIDHCEVWDSCIGSSEEMISIVTVEHFEVSNCIVHDPASLQRIGICLKEGCSYGEVHHNHVYNLTGYYPDGIYIDARQWDSEHGHLEHDPTHDINIYCNLIHDIPLGDGITVNDECSNSYASAISDISVYNNIVYNVKDSGLMLNCFGAAYQHTFTNVYFVNNTLYNCDYGGNGDNEINLLQYPAYVTNCVVRNNIVMSLTSGKRPIFDPHDCYGEEKVLIDNNLFYNSGGAWYMTLATLGDNYVEGNPLFISGTFPFDFSIPTGSPAKDAGSATLAPATDYLGISRPQGVADDIGAFEYNEGVATVPSITLSVATNVASTSARLNASITSTGGENPTVTFYWGTTDGGQTAGDWDLNGAPTSPAQPQGVATCYKDVSNLLPDTNYYFTAKAVNSAGTTWVYVAYTLKTMTTYEIATKISLNARRLVLVVS